MASTPSDSPAPAEPRREHRASGLADLPRDELLRYGRELGLDLPLDIDPPELVRRVRQRQELLVQLDREAMLDIVVWARRPVRKSASKEALAREIAQVDRARYDGLSHRGLLALAALRGVRVSDGETDSSIAERLRRADGFWKRLSRRRRRVVGAILSNLFEDRRVGNGEDYRFLPEDETSGKVSLRAEIEERGLMGGLASRLRGVADDYVRAKLDEIEARIDRKLNEIDRRLGEWRDREIANRLKIIRLTLIASVLFAALSIGYHLLKREMMGDAGPPPAGAVLPDQPQDGRN